MHIDNLLEQVKQQIEQNRTSVTLCAPQNWTQGRTLYGGLSASLAYQAAKGIVSPNKPLLGLNTSFIGPIEPEVPFSIMVELLREGKNTSVVKAEITQNSKISLSALATFGLARKSKIKIDNNVKHNMERPTKASFTPMIPKITPKFFTHFELAKVNGGWPFTGTKTSELGGWMRFKQAPVVFTDAHLVTLIDMWPPAILQMLRWPAPASTMSWNLELIQPHTAFNANSWFAYQATTRQAANGYAHTEANIWDEDDNLIALSRQIVAVFA